MDESDELSCLFESAEEEQDFIDEANLEKLVKKYKPSSFSLKRSAWDVSKSITEPRPIDILIGRFVSHPGNILLRKVITANRAYFQSLPQTEQRKIATDALIGFFETKGCRFLESANGEKNTFHQATYSAVSEKFRKSLRETGFRSNARKPPCKVSNKEVASKKTKPVKVKASSEKRLVVSTVKQTNFSSRTENAPTPSTHSVYVGDRLAIFWPDDRVYYPGLILSVSGPVVQFKYDDGEQESLDLSRTEYLVVRKASPVIRALDDSLSLKECKTRRVSNDWKRPKTSPENSVKTQDSSASYDLMDNPANNGSMVFTGSYKEPIAVDVPTLASFLSQLRGSLKGSRAKKA